MGLAGKLHRVADLTKNQIETMFGLMDTHYRNVRRDDFERDLAEKDYAILLSDTDNQSLQGFSTQMLLEHQYDGEDLQIVFSGDTIIDPQYWGTIALPVSFGEMMFGFLKKHPQRRLFWMLISKGYRTYRFLPVFFKSFFPRNDQPVPSWEKGLIDSLGQRKFPQLYDPATGIVRATPGAQALRETLATIGDLRQERNPHIRFFLEKNPGYIQGDEIVCLCPFYRENLRPFILRELQRQGIIDPIIPTRTT